MLNRVLGLGTCLDSPSPLPSVSLAGQWSSWRCVRGRYHDGLLPWAQFLKGGGHALLQYVTVDVGVHGSLNEL